MTLELWLVSIRKSNSYKMMKASRTDMINEDLPHYHKLQEIIKTVMNLKNTMSEDYSIG